MEEGEGLGVGVGVGGVPIVELGVEVVGVVEEGAEGFVGGSVCVYVCVCGCGGGGGGASDGEPGKGEGGVFLLILGFCHVLYRVNE